MAQGPGVRLLPPSTLAQWQALPAAVVSDECTHCAVLARVRPLFPGRAFAGQAFTIEVTRDENHAPRVALAHLWQYACIVIDARVAPDAAVFGANLTRIARDRGAIAVVVDGNVRDAAELRESGVAICSRGITPRGPRWTGRFGFAIACGGVRIEPGDLVIGDDDGVVAVPLSNVTDELLARCRARIAREAEESAR